MNAFKILALLSLLSPLSIAADTSYCMEIQKNGAKMDRTPISAFFCSIDNGIFPLQGFLPEKPFKTDFNTQSSSVVLTNITLFKAESHPSETNGPLVLSVQKADDANAPAHKSTNSINVSELKGDAASPAAFSFTFNAELEKNTPYIFKFETQEGNTATIPVIVAQSAKGESVYYPCKSMPMGVNDANGSLSKDWGAYMLMHLKTLKK